MSFSSKVTFGASIAFTVAAVSLVHLAESWEHQRLRRGVIRDIEKDKQKIQNMKLLQDNIELEKILKEQRKEEAAISAD